MARFSMLFLFCLPATLRKYSFSTFFIYCIFCGHGFEIFSMKNMENLDTCMSVRAQIFFNTAFNRFQIAIVYGVSDSSLCDLNCRIFQIPK